MRRRFNEQAPPAERRSPHRGAALLGATAPPPEPPGPVRPTSDPAVLVRSLGPAPLAVDPAVVERHLTAVYEEAVRAARALAAANGVLATDDETEEAAR